MSDCRRLVAGQCDYSVDAGACKPARPIVPGTTATIDFWHSKKGLQLLNATPRSPALGDWLAGNFPKLYGTLAGKRNVFVGAKFQKFFRVSGPKTHAQVMGAALAVYLTNSDLAGTVAAKYGFHVFSPGTGALTYNVGSMGTVLGLANDTDYTVLQLLHAANDNYPWDAAVFNALNTIFPGINVRGDIR